MVRLLFLVLLLVGANTTYAQSPFEVASIKPSDPANCGEYPRIDTVSDRTTMNCVTLKYLVQIAYGVRDFQIAGAPWMESTRYDIIAKAAPIPEDAKDVASRTDAERMTIAAVLRARLQPLLADRFQLEVHREKKESPVYFLRQARGGSKLTATGEGTHVSGGLRVGRGLLAGSMTRMSFLAQTLSQIMGRPVLDQTGLTDKYDFELRWTPDQSSANSALGGQLPVRPDAQPADQNIPTIFTALQEQLGLKLESGRAPVDVIVIDRAEKASAN